MPFCPNCGANLEKEVAFCPYCGATLKRSLFHETEAPSAPAAPSRGTREDRWERRRQLREERRKARAEARARKMEEKEEKEEKGEKGEKGEKQEKGEKEEKGEKHEGQRHGYVGPLVGGFILLWLGSTFYFQLTGNPALWIVQDLFIGGFVLLVLIGIIYGARVASKRTPRT